MNTDSEEHEKHHNWLRRIIKEEDDWNKMLEWGRKQAKADEDRDKFWQHMKNKVVEWAVMGVVFAAVTAIYQVYFNGAS